MLRRGRCPASSASRLSSPGDGHADEESVKLFIGGLAWATNEASLRAAFAKYGEVTDAVVILDRETGRSRGFGFVTFAAADDGKRALEEMNGYSLDGRAIRCSEATERPGRGRPDSRGPRPAGGDSRPGGGRSFDGGPGGGRPFREDRGRPPMGGGGAGPGGAGGSRGPSPSRGRFETTPPPDTDDRSKRSREKKRRVREPVPPLDDDRGSRSRAPRRRGGGGGGRPEIFKNLDDYDDDIG